MSLRTTTAVFLLALAVAGSEASADEIRFFDTDFSDSDWQTTVTSSGLSGATAYQFVSGGNNVRRVTHTVASAPDSLSVIHLNLNAAYDPSVSGAIHIIGFSLNFNEVSTSGEDHDIALVAFQDGKTFAADLKSTASSPKPYTFSYEPADFPSWHSVEQLFYEISFAPGLTAYFPNFASHPDFSSTGSQITFGFVTGSYVLSPSEPITVDYDDFDLRLTPVPEPSSILLAGISVVAALGHRLRRKRTEPGSGPPQFRPKGAGFGVFTRLR